MVHVLALLALSTPAHPLDAYDVVWTTPSDNAAGSMPIGNGEVVLNVWVEKATGDVLLNIARDDALSEISRILKLGRVRVHLSPSPLASATDFAQHLHVRDGSMSITGGGLALELLVDSEANVIHLRGSSVRPVGVAVTVESWRTASRTLPSAEKWSAWSVHDAPFPLVESADQFVAGSEPAIEWYHRNETSVVPQVLENQSLTGLKGTTDPLLHRTFGGRVVAAGFHRRDAQTLASDIPLKRFDLKIATHTAQTRTVAEWLGGLRREAQRSDAPKAKARTRDWWHAFWERSWVFVEGDDRLNPVPTNSDELRRGVDANGGNVFPGRIDSWRFLGEAVSGADLLKLMESDNLIVDDIPPSRRRQGITLLATILPREMKPGRIFDKITPGGNDGFLFDTHPGNALRLIVGDMALVAPDCLKLGVPQRVGATYDAETGEAAIFLDGVRVAHRPAERGSLVTRGYVLQRYVNACQGRGEFPIKFNGGTYTVEPAAMGMPFNADWRNWGDCHWFQNVRHTVHPMLATGDFDLMEPFFRLYENARPLAEARTAKYHGVQGAYFPETMTVWGTYSGGDYGWNRTGHQPKDVLCPWWDDAWNQGPELVALMLDRWEYTRDAAFLKRRVLPMAESVLRYFDTRFQKDAAGKIVLDPTQVVETYWNGVVNDMPATAGLIAVAERLTTLPPGLATPAQKTFFERMRRACPSLPLETNDGERELAPAQKYDPNRSNVENGELYGVWPFRLVSLARPALLEEAKRAYAHRGDHLDQGWGYDGNVAALLGMTDEAARILLVKCRNSNPAYRWPATWGPNFDWLPDQNHGGNLLNTANLMLLQAEPLEAGGQIRLLPAWPKGWDVDFKLRAPGNTTVRCVARSGRIVKLEVSPKARTKDIVWPEGWAKPR